MCCPHLSRFSVLSSPGLFVHHPCSVWCKAGQCSHNSWGVTGPHQSWSTTHINSCHLGSTLATDTIRGMEMSASLVAGTDIVCFSAEL